MSIDFTLKLDFKGWYLISVCERLNCPTGTIKPLLCRELRKSCANCRQFSRLGWAPEEGP